jgi:predicted RNase H-like HicB family nuclease
MKYAAVIHKDSDSDYGVTFPDLEGCFSAGETFEQALEMAQEAAELHLEGYLEEGMVIPEPASMDTYIGDKLYRGGVWAFVDVDLAKLSGKSKRVNITIPERLLATIDAYVAEHGAKRSSFMVDAAVNYMAEHRA